MKSAYPMGNLAILGDCNEDCIAKADGCYSRLDAFDCPNSPFGGSREGGFGLLDGIWGRVIDRGHFVDSRSMRRKLLLLFRSAKVVPHHQAVRRFPPFCRQNPAAFVPFDFSPRLQQLYRVYIHNAEIHSSTAETEAQAKGGGRYAGSGYKLRRGVRICQE